MLLLVLILVALAFGVLVFALQAENSLAAWASVGLSAAAALVLLIDWLQRRSALRAGEASLDAADERPRTLERSGPVPGYDEPDPATEVLPVVPPVGVTGGRPPRDDGASDEPTMIASRTPAGPERPDGGPSGPSNGGPGIGHHTVAMPAVQPSGSAVQPSGAPERVTGSSGLSSPSVTNVAASTSPSFVKESPERVDAPQAPAAPPAEPVGHDGPTERGTEAVRAPGAGGAVAGAAGVAGAAAAVGAVGATTAQDGRSPSTPERDVRQPEQQPPGRDGARAGSSTLSGSDLFGSGGPQGPPLAEPRAAQDGPTAEHGPGTAVDAPVDPSAARTTVAASLGTGPSGRPDDVTAAADGPDREPSVPPVGGAPVQGPADAPADPVAAQEQDPPATTDSAAEPGEEPGEESADPSTSDLVAGLDDDVIVIDEQPRYHVDGCRALADHEPIPLPVAEAVELGFTPCGWCTPNRTLAQRHQPATR